MSKRRLWLSLFGGAFVMLGLLWMVTGGGRAKVTAPQLPPPSTTTQLSAADLAFGRQQVDQMMRDRSQMAVCVERGDVVYLWAVRQFAGEAVGQHIYWSNEPPECPPHCTSSSGSFHPNSSVGSVRVRERYKEGGKIGQILPCEELWSCAVFELYNTANSNDFKNAYRAALAGKLSKQEWIQEITKIEFKAAQKTAQFYRLLWKPRAKNENVTTESYYWYVDQPDNYEEWISEYDDPSGYPYGNYNALYDRDIAPYVSR